MEQRNMSGYPSIDKPWLQYYSEEAINAKLPECTVYEYIWQHNKEYLSDIALEYYGCKITYRKLFREVERTVKALRQAGVHKGDCVAMCMAGVPEAVYIVLAYSRIGAIANFVNPMFTMAQMVDRINDTEANLLFVLDKMHSYIAAAIDQTCVKRVIAVPAAGALPALARCLARKPDTALAAAMWNNAGYVFWRDFIRAGESYTGPVEEAYAKDTPVVMVYSSGTTGASKGIQLTNDGINAVIHAFVFSGINFTRYQRYLHIVPIWFSTGVVFNLLLPLQIGMVTILEPIFSKETFAQNIKKYKPTHMMVAASLWLGAMQLPELADINLSFLVLPMTGGEALLPKVEKELNRFIRSRGSTANICKGYGMCELGSAATAAANNFNITGSVGIPLPHVTVAAFDLDTDAELPYNRRGELRVISPCRMLGYYKNPEATAEFFRTGRDGQVWGCTGDIGYVDKDGNVFVLGLASDCYTGPDGKRHYLFDAENVILQDEAVDLCEVVDIPMDGRPVPVAHLLLNKECADAPQEVIRRVDALCRTLLDPYAVPRGYKIRSGFAVKPSGKRDTGALKAERTGFMTEDGKNVSFGTEAQEANP